MGFLQICGGVVLLQLSKSAKDVPDAAVFKGDLDQLREVAEKEESETEPKADAIRGTGSIIRRISTSRQKIQEEEARRYYEEKRLDETSEPADNEIIEWDGLRRRRTTISDGSVSSRGRARSVAHPPLGMSRLPEDGEFNADGSQRPQTSRSGSSRYAGMFSRASSSNNLHPRWKSSHPESTQEKDAQKYSEAKNEQGLLDPFSHTTAARGRSGTNTSIQWADDVKQKSSEKPPTPPPHRVANRQFSFQRIFALNSSHDQVQHSPSREKTLDHDTGRRLRHEGRILGFPSPFNKHQNSRAARRTEEESLGLVHDNNNDDSPQDPAGHAVETIPSHSTAEHQDGKETSTSYRRSDSPESISSPSSPSEPEKVDDDKSYSENQLHPPLLQSSSPHPTSTQSLPLQGDTDHLPPSYPSRLRPARQFPTRHSRPDSDQP